MIVSLSFIELVKEFANLVLESGKPVVAVSGEYRVDAGSIMGLFSLDLTKSITLVFLEEAEELQQQLQKFVKDKK